MIGEFLLWFGFSLLSFIFFLLKIFFNNIFYFNNFILFIYFLFFTFFLFPPFLLSCVADKVLVLQPGVRPEPLRWGS